VSLVKTTGGPLCPLSIGTYKHPQHATLDRVSDVIFEAMKPMVDEETGEASQEVERVAAAARYGYDINEHGMRLYVDEAQIAEGRFLPVLRVEAWYFQCPVCGFVLPALAERS
jgi:hypothetical protein